MIKHNALSLLIITGLLVIAGCSISDSSKSSSDSFESIFSSPSSSSQTNKQYQQDVSDFTMAYVKSTVANADYNSFAKGISDIASKRGITNWEQESSTYVAIGKGLKRSGSTGVAYETYKKNFTHGNVNNMQSIQEGYDKQD